MGRNHAQQAHAWLYGGVCLRLVPMLPPTPTDSFILVQEHGGTFPIKRAYTCHLYKCAAEAVLS
jgi:hypothetical protein